MTGFSLIHHEPTHARTTSDPPISHPTVLKLEQELHNFKTRLNPNVQTLCNALRELASLYKSVDELLSLPTTQRALAHLGHKKWVEDQLDDSIKLLDLVGASRDYMASVVEYVQDLRSAAAARKSKGGEMSQKKMLKEARTCFKLLRQVECSCACSGIVKDWEFVAVDRVMVEMKEIVVALFRCLMCLAAAAVRQKVLRAGGRWGEEDDQLKELENRVEVLFRRLIQNRVSLLNALSL